MMKTGIRKRRFPSILILFILILSTVLFTDMILGADEVMEYVKKDAGICA